MDVTYYISYDNNDTENYRLSELLMINKLHLIINNNVKSNIAKAIFDLLDNKYSNVVTLRMSIFNITQQNLEYFMTFIKNNKSLKYINICFIRPYHFDINTDINMDLCLKNIAVMIHNHPCIKHLSINSSNITTSIIDIVNHKPKTLTHIYLTNNKNLDPAALTYLIKYGNMKVIDVNFIDLLSDCVIEPDIFQYNNSIINFAYIDSSYYLGGRMPIDYEIEAMLNRNNEALNKARHTALTFIFIRKYRYNACKIIEQLPKGIVKIIANYIYDSYIDDEWRS